MKDVITEAEVEMKGHKARKCGYPPEAGKGKETGSPPQASEEM